MVQGVMDVIPYQLLTAYDISFEEALVHLPKQVIPGIALRSSAHLMTIGSASSEVDGAQEKGENKSGENPSRIAHRGDRKRSLSA